MQTLEYDLVVIGSGPAGYKAAVTARHLGARVAIIEKSLPGGTCLNQGCVPKATLIRIAKLLDEVEAFRGQGVNGHIHGDFQQAMQRKNNVIKSIRSGLSPWLRQLGIRIIHGQAVFLDGQTIEVRGVNEDTGQLCFVKARRFVIATGAQPKQHPHCLTDGQFILDSTQFMWNLDRCPDSILIIGGGAIGTELSYLLNRFGSQVTIAEQHDRLLAKPCIPQRASQALERRFRKLDITVKKNTSVIDSQLTDQGVQIGFNDGSRETYDKVLVAIGRQPNVEGLMPGNAGVTLNQDGFIQVNEFLQTQNPAIYAIGDVKPGPMTANAAFHDAKIAAGNAMCGNHSMYNYNRVPIVIDSALTIATVGLSEERAEDAGFEPEAARINLAGSTKARITQNGEGYIEVVHDEETGQLLGGCVVGSQAGEMIHMLTAACQSDRGLWFFTDISYSHPSWNEELENAIHGCVSTFSQSDLEIFKPGIYAG